MTEAQDYVYSQEVYGKLKDYLREHNGFPTANLFRGVEFFITLIDENLLLPWTSCIRVCRSPMPDIEYLIDENFLLLGFGRREPNMSLVGAERGTHQPEEALKNELWSVSNINLEVLFNRDGTPKTE